MLRVRKIKMIRPSKPLRRAKPSPQLAQALAHQAHARQPSIRERILHLRQRVDELRAVTYLLTLANRQF